MRTTFIFVTLASLLSAAVPACALNFFELEVYPATTEGQGLHEVENLTTFVAQGRRPNDEEKEGEEPRRHRLLRDDSVLGALLGALIGYRSRPSLLEVLAFSTYLPAMGWALHRADVAARGASERGPARSAA